MAKKRTPSKLSKKAADLVARERVCRVATVSADGQPHLVPVCHVLAGGKLYIIAQAWNPRLRGARTGRSVGIQPTHVYLGRYVFTTMPDG